MPHPVLRLTGRVFIAYCQEHTRCQEESLKMMVTQA